MIGDSIFAVGALVLGWFVLGLVTGHSFDRGSSVLAEGEYTPRKKEKALEEGETRSPLASTS